MNSSGTIGGNREISQINKLGRITKSALRIVNHRTTSFGCVSNDYILIINKASLNLEVDKHPLHC